MYHSIQRRRVWVIPYHPGGDGGKWNRRGTYSDISFGAGSTEFDDRVASGGLALLVEEGGDVNLDGEGLADAERRANSGYRMRDVGGAD